MGDTCLPLMGSTCLPVMFGPLLQGAKKDTYADDELDLSGIDGADLTDITLDCVSPLKVARRRDPSDIPCHSPLGPSALQTQARSGGTANVLLRGHVKDAPACSEGTSISEGGCDVKTRAEKYPTHPAGSDLRIEDPL
eukprot:Rmarinus@m.4920